MTGEDPFPNTRWTIVLQARGEEGVGGATALQAMGELCEMYWFPIYAYARRRGMDPGDAEDATQGFFAHLLEGRMLERANRERGRLRAFLLAGFKKFLVDVRRREGAEKRGGKVSIESLDVAGAEERYSAELVGGRTPEQLYERRWALEVVERVMRTLEQGYAERGRSEVFETLKPHLEWNAGGATYAEMAEALGLSEAGVQQEVKRMRRRFRKTLEDEIAGTVERPEDVAGELRCLIMALG